MLIFGVKVTVHRDLCLRTLTSILHPSQRKTDKTDLEPILSLLQLPDYAFWGLLRLVNHHVTSHPERERPLPGGTLQTLQQILTQFPFSLWFLFFMVSVRLRHRRLEILEHISVLNPRIWGKSLAWLWCFDSVPGDKAGPGFHHDQVQKSVLMLSALQAPIRRDKPPNK